MSPQFPSSAVPPPAVDHPRARRLAPALVAGTALAAASATAVVAAVIAAVMALRPDWRGADATAATLGSSATLASASAIVATVMMAAAALGALLGWLAARRIARTWTDPLVALADATAALARQADGSRRLPETGDDAQAAAARGINLLMAEWQRRDEALALAHRQLLQQVQDTQQARQHAEGASQSRSRFLATMSHELRSPLNGLIGATTLLRLQGADAARREELLDIVGASGQSLRALVEGVLDLARIEAGAMQVEREDFDLLDTAEAAVQAVSAEAQAKGLRLWCRVDPAVTAWRLGDGARVRQLLQILLGNAVKFTARGEVGLRVQAGGPAGHLNLTVCDTGPGFEPRALAAFQGRQVGSTTPQPRAPGGGLGLAVVHELVLRMDGQVALASETGQGSRVTLQLPLPPSTQAPPEPAPLGLRLAWFEPHTASAEALGALLRRLGCDAQACRGPEDLRAYLSVPDRHGRPARLLVAVDCAEGRMLLAATAGWLDPGRIIRIGGLRDGESADAPRAIPRPVLRAALAARLGLVIGQARPAGGPGRLAVTSRGHVLLVEDDAVNQCVVRGLLEHAGFRCSIAADGAQALDSLRQGDIDLVLMDLQLPGIDGLETTRRLRQGEAGDAARVIPVLALTASALAEDRQACLDAGMNAHLAKPVDADQLLDTVQRWRQAGPLPAAAVTADALPVFDPRVLQALPTVAESNRPGYVDELLALFDRCCDADLAAADQALAEVDLVTLQRSVHTLKSNAAQIGAAALAAEAARQEARLRAGQPPDPDGPQRLREHLQTLRAHLAARRSLQADVLTTP